MLWFAGLSIALLAGGDALRAVAAEVVWELRPYRIVALLGHDGAPEWTAQRLEGLAESLPRRAKALAGAVWRLEAQLAAEELAVAIRADWRRLEENPTAQAFVSQAGYPPAGQNLTPVDKVIFVRLAATAEGSHIAAREWDAYTGSWGPSITRPLTNSAVAPAVLFSAVEAAFSAVAQVDSQGQGAWLLRVRGGDLTPRDASLAAVRDRDVFRIVKRTTGPQGRPLATVTPWTFAVVDKATGAKALSRISSLYRDPLSATLGSGESWVALKQSALGAATRLTFISPDGGALAGYEIWATRPGVGTGQPLGRTDGRGTIQIPPASEPMQTLYVKSGSNLLARLPLSPGWPAEAEITLPSDDDRLGAEGVVRALEQRLFELAAEREITLALYRAKWAEKSLDAAETLLKDLQEYDKKRQDFEQLVQSRRGQASAGNPAAQAQIDNLFQQLLERAPKVLDNSETQKLAAEYGSAREAEFKPFRPKDGGIQITAPGTPTETTQRMPAPQIGEVEVTKIVTELKPLQLAMETWIIDIPPGYHRTDQEVFLDWVKDVASGLMSFKIASERKGPTDDPYREYFGQAQDKACAVRMVYIQPKLYVLISIGEKDAVESAESVQFLQSLQRK